MTVKGSVGGGWVDAPTSIKFPRTSMDVYTKKAKNAVDPPNLARDILRLFSFYLRPVASLPRDFEASTNMLAGPNPAVSLGGRPMSIIGVRSRVRYTPILAFGYCWRAWVTYCLYQALVEPLECVMIMILLV